MTPNKLYIKNFMCYSEATIDFREFSAALIVGKLDNNEEIANGVGKTTIFKAIEYCLFNYCDGNLESIIRDDTDICSVGFDFTVDNQEYRIQRTRTRKGVADLSLFRKDQDWVEISGRRANDTEKDIAKLIKVNAKNFRTLVHFVQNDFSGLTSATPEKRKVILKEALNLAVYSKLEKIAKEKFSLLEKEISKFSTLIENLGDPGVLLLQYAIDLDNAENHRLLTNNKLITVTDEINQKNNNVSSLIEQQSTLENKFAQLILQEQNIIVEKKKLEISVKEYTTKKSNTVNIGKDLVADLKKLEDDQTKLQAMDFTQIAILTEQISKNREKNAELNLTIQNDMARYEKLKIPMPEDGECEHCRQILTKEHIEACKPKIIKELQEKQLNIQNCKKEIVNLNFQNTTIQNTVNQLTSAKQQLENTITKITAKKNEVNEKKKLYKEYNDLLIKFTQELSDKEIELKNTQEQISKTPLNEVNIIKNSIILEKEQIQNLKNDMNLINKELMHFTSQKMVIQNNIDQKTQDKQKKEEYAKFLQEIDKKAKLFPSVIQSFSNAGIPNLIIQNMLEDLQIEANILLNRLKPNLQIAFSIAKTTGDGVEADTLDIEYFYNGKKRYYQQLSGAMQLAVNFGLKLGLSFFLQKMLGVNVKLLLLDEIDQAFDKASVNYFADIVKSFQKDYTILVITHNDKLKDKFSHAILVEQDTNMISTARVVNSW